MPLVDKELSIVRRHAPPARPSERDGAARATEPARRRVSASPAFTHKDHLSAKPNTVGQDLLNQPRWIGRGLDRYESRKLVRRRQQDHCGRQSLCPPLPARRRLPPPEGSPKSRSDLHEVRSSRRERPVSTGRPHHAQPDSVRNRMETRLACAVLQTDNADFTDTNLRFDPGHKHGSGCNRPRNGTDYCPFRTIE